MRQAARHLSGLEVCERARRIRIFIPTFEDCGLEVVADSRKHVLDIFQGRTQSVFIAKARESTCPISGQEALQKSASGMMRRCGVPDERDRKIGECVPGKAVIDPEAAPALQEGARYRGVPQFV